MTIKQSNHVHRANQQKSLPHNNELGNFGKKKPVSGFVPAGKGHRFLLVTTIPLRDAIRSSARKMSCKLMILIIQTRSDAIIKFKCYTNY
jgi:hypothetical protein